MKSHKQLLMDFYLNLLAIPPTNLFRLNHQELYGTVRSCLAKELGEDDKTIQRIFERMAAEDNPNEKI